MTPMTTLPHRLAGALLALALVSAACGGASAPTTAPPSPGRGGGASVTPAPSVAEPTPVPGTSGDPGVGQGGGSEPGNPGAGVPVPIDPGTGGGVPAVPAPTMVTPVTGLTGVHPVAAAKLEAAVNGRNVAVRVAWWSGVEPCNALAGITVARDGNKYLLTVNEGSAAPPDRVCIEIAMYKAAVVDLGELDPGTYTINAFGDAPPVEVTVAG